MKTPEHGTGNSGFRANKYGINQGIKLVWSPPDSDWIPRVRFVIDDINCQATGTGTGDWGLGLGLGNGKMGKWEIESTPVPAQNFFFILIVILFDILFYLQPLG